MVESSEGDSDYEPEEELPEDDSREGAPREGEGGDEPSQAPSTTTTRGRSKGRGRGRGSSRGRGRGRGRGASQAQEGSERGSPTAGDGADGDGEEGSKQQGGPWYTQKKEEVEAYLWSKFPTRQIATWPPVMEKTIELCGQQFSDETTPGSTMSVTKKTKCESVAMQLQAFVTEEMGVSDVWCVLRGGG